MISLYLVVGCIAFVRVFARSSQQLNVCYFKWWRVPFYSMGMSYPDAFLWAGAGYAGAEAGIEGALLYGTALWIGSWFGTWAGMYFFKRTDHEREE